MRQTLDPSCRVSVVASATDTGCWYWIIRTPSGEAVASSPYAFASRTGARLSGECRRLAMLGAKSPD